MCGKATAARKTHLRMTVVFLFSRVVVFYTIAYANRVVSSKAAFGAYET